MSYSAILPCIHNDSDLVNIYSIVCMLWKNKYIYRLKAKNKHFYYEFTVYDINTAM